MMVDEEEPVVKGIVLGAGIEVEMTEVEVCELDIWEDVVPIVVEVVEVDVVFVCSWITSAGVEFIDTVFCGSLLSVTITL